MLAFSSEPPVDASGTASGSSSRTVSGRGMPLWSSQPIMNKDGPCGPPVVSGGSQPISTDSSYLPVIGERMPSQEVSSPRKRGSSRGFGKRNHSDSVVPAQAGVIRAGSWCPLDSPGRPRASGGHPLLGRTCAICSGSSPRKRGSSRNGPERGVSEGVVPAQAGVIQLRSSTRRGFSSRPRASGGHPL